jgi:NADPH:quinone reductase-like Zn-dependent oxidoreductase
MRALTLDASGTAPTLHDDVPAPEPGAGEVLVRVETSSVNPVDNAIAAGMLEGMFEHEFPVTLGRDYAGAVERVGEGVTRYAPGEEVYGFIRHADPTVHDGSWAELIVVPEDMSIAHRPEHVDVSTAGAAPLVGITAIALVNAVELSTGDVVIVVGANGGVGSLAVQLAAQAGAAVVAPARDDDDAYLRDLGVTERIDRDGDVAGVVRERHPEGVDAAIDLVSYAPGAFDAALKDGGRVASPNSAAGDGPGRTNVLAEPTRENLERLARALEAGTLRVPIQDSYPLDQAGEALQVLATAHQRGKLAMRIG